MKRRAALHNFRGIVFPIEKYSCERDKGGIQKKMEQKLESIGDREPTERYFSIALANFIVITITMGRVGISAAL